MLPQRRFRIAVSILICFLLKAQGADKYTDENRPYEFGFNVEIDGNKQQHRHEKKDKDGIIMGEFGFVTADDVYHVTVYATDKEGRFKILSMKNIHLKSSSAASGSALSPRQGHALALPASVAGQATPASPQASPTSTPKALFKQISLQPPVRSCSSCSIPTTTVRAAPVAPPVNLPASAVSPDIAQRNAFGTQPFTLQRGSPNVQAYPQQPIQPHSIHSQTNQPQSIQPQENYPGSFGTGPIPNTPNNNAQSGPSVTLEQGMPQGFPGQHLSSSYPGQNPSQSYPDQSPSQGLLGHSTPHGFPIKSPEENYPQSNGQEYSNNLSPGQNSYPQGGSPGRTSKKYNGPQRPFDSNGGSNGPQGFNHVQLGQLGPVKPTLVSAQMQIVDKNIDVNALGPGETRGLPPGLTKDYMSQLLYTFNYTVGFHGHFEEGYTNGFKKGYYFVTGRNGVRTRIDYEADDTGFHPKVSQEVLDLLSEDVPKPETEKDEKYGLKGYEFKWLYYPVGSKKR